ncbi:hypothetical protein GCM10027286_13590 [Virgibacillus ainsalahensis]
MANESRIHFSGFENEDSPLQWLKAKEEKGNQFIQRITDIIDDYYDKQSK